MDRRSGEERPNQQPQISVMEAAALVSNTGDTEDEKAAVMDTDMLPSATKTSPSAVPSSSSSSSDANADAATAASAPKACKKTYTEMVHQAIDALKDRTGSSQIAIQKYIISEFNQTDNPAFRSRVLQAIKTGLKNNRFTKYRASFKIHGDWRKKQRAKKAREAARKEKERRKRQEDLRKQHEADETDRLKSLEGKLSDGEFHVLKRKHEEKLEKQRKKAEAEQKARERAERLKRRRFPMEDTRLHSEDKEFNIKPPSSVKRRPFVPYAFQLVKRHGKNTAVPHSKCEYLAYDSRGLISDVLQVYHFFQGDVKFSKDNPIVADFTITQLLYATDEVINGNAKRNKLVPPLIVHLFVTSLNLLLASPVVGETREAIQLQRDLANLYKALSPVSWSEVCALYMDCMERYYTCSSSIEKEVLQGGFTDTKFLLSHTDEPSIPETMPDLPDGYGAYLGDARSSLAKAHSKLVKSDPWNLSAEELLALLRALTDDVLASRPELTADFTDRDEEVYALLRAKRTADSNFRKIKLAYEGPKNRSLPKKDEIKKAKGKGVNGDKPKELEWKQSATKKQFEQAQKEQSKANKEYEKCLRGNICRSEPIGVDRNFNRVYFFPNAADSLFVEMIRPPLASFDNFVPIEFQMNRTSWHVLENVSAVDQFSASLDARGHREGSLRNAIEGVKKHVFDDLKEAKDKVNRKEKRLELDKKLEEAREAVKREDENGGRRSGRLQIQSPAQAFLSKILREIDDLEKKIKSDEDPIVYHYSYLTGQENLLKYETSRKRKSRKFRELVALGTAQDSTSHDHKCVPCSPIWPNSSSQTGLIGIIVTELLGVEELCENLVPWENAGMGRSEWIAKLHSLATAWNRGCPAVLGPEQDLANGGVMISTSEPELKKQRIDTGIPTGQSSTVNVMAGLKQSLLDLEARIFEVSGLGVATRDADEADENMSIVEDDKETGEPEQEQKRRVVWRKKIHTLRSIPSKRSGQIRETIVQSINAARKAQQRNIVSALRKALLVYHPDAPAECKVAAIAILDENGGYDAREDDEDEDETEEEENSEEEDEPASSHLSGEAMMLTGSLGGDDHANRIDWIGAVKACKTVSRLSALATAFSYSATALLDKLLGERDSLEKAIAAWEKLAERAKRQNKKFKSNHNIKDQPTEVWTAVHFLDEFCMVKLDNFPFWPARKCRAKDDKLEETLASLGRCLVSLVGEDGRLRVVKKDGAKEFTGTIAAEENLEQQPKEIRSQLFDCIAMARRIVRGQKGKTK